MRGGLVFFRGAGAAARAYLESDHSHADEYYLEGGGAVASWSALDADGVAIDAADLDGTAYQAWVDWTDPRTGMLRGTPRDEVRVKVDGELRITPSSPRFVEMTVNVDKSLSVAAALNPAVSAALDAAEADATRAMNTYMAQNSVTRIGPRGAQRLVPVERIESVSVVHRSSRAGDPHRHVHVQWNTRVYAEGQWRALHTAATLKQQGALRGVGEATINSHAGLQQALAHAGFEFDVSTGRVTNLHEQARTLSKRAQQIERNVVTFEAEWRRAHPGQDPSGELRREWDQRAWAHERPRKRQSEEHPEQKWIDELRDAGLQVDGFSTVPAPERITLDELDADMLRGDVLAAVEQRRSAWSVADLEGHIGVAVGERGVIAGPAEITQFAKDVAADIARTLPVLELDVDGQLPTWVRHFTSDHVVTVEHQLRDALDARGLQSGLPFGNPTADIDGLTHEQAAGAAALATRAPLVVIEGAAGSGKTTMLGAARDLAAANGQTLVVVAPTLRAAQEASAALGTKASSAHKLAHEYGFRWTDDGRWSRLAVGDLDPDTGQPYRGPWHESVLTSSTRLVVDEAGMVDQDLGLALLTIADETGASVAFVGDRAQLPAVGRGGVLDMAVAASPRPLDLTELHRFREPGYAELTIAMRERRSPGATFDQLLERGNIVVHDADALVWDSITADVVRKAEAGATVAVAVTSNDTATEINALVQEAHARAGRTSKSGVEISGRDELQLRIGDRIMTRRNDRELGVANRDTWTVTRISRNGVVTVSGDGRSAQLPREYVEEHTHLAYASTEYGVQGATVDVGHGILTDASNAQAVYVAATRGRQENTLHLVAGDIDEARALFVDAMEREAGDRGIEAAREAARRDVAGLVLQPEVDDIDPTIRAERMAYEERLYGARVRDWKAATASWEKRHPGVWAAEVAVTIERLEHETIGATTSVRDRERTLSTAAERRHVDTWTADFATVDQARVDARSATVFRRKTAEQAYDAAVARFTMTHGHEPVATPPRALRERWQTAAIRPGVDARLDELRRHVGELRVNLESLKSDPVPRPPVKPSTGTAAQEAAKDARYLQRQRQRTAQERTRTTAAPTAQPKTPRQPGLER